MASLIYEETGTGQRPEVEPVSELAMRAEPVPLEEPSGPDGLTATHCDVSAARAASTSVAERVYRHRLPVRISHWLNVPCLLILIMSGLQIFNAHPPSIGATVPIVTAVALNSRREGREW